jgi:CDGSH iron-sulfur domain-containing protein 3
MARIVKRSASGPYRIEVGGEAKFICGCGLSANQPYCDGTHKTTRAEEGDRLYWYDEAGHRHECGESYTGIRGA